MRTYVYWVMGLMAVSAFSQILLLYTQNTQRNLKNTAWDLAICVAYLVAGAYVLASS